MSKASREIAPVYRPLSPVRDAIGSELVIVEIATAATNNQSASTALPEKINRPGFARMLPAKIIAIRIKVRNSTEEFLSKACGNTLIGM